MSKKKDLFIHSTSIVDKGAVIGEGTKIWHWSHITKDALIGSSCSIGQNVFVGKAIIGNNVKVQNNVSIFDNVTLEDYVFCGPSVVFTNVYNPRAEINRKKEYKNTVVKKGVTLGANSTVICGIEIGEYAFIGAAALVNKNVPSYALMIGVPARQVGWMSAYGERINLPIIGKGEYICPFTGDLYILNEKVLRKSNPENIN